ncbi:MAG: cation diffusion facilitator family transporter [Chitinophagaceae bacterium]
MKSSNQNLRVQKWVAAISLLLLIIKFVAYYLTHSVSILTDAMESIVNVAAGFIGLYSLYVAAKPRDRDHPYGHGKAEFLSAAIEGTMIMIAGVIIIYKAVEQLVYPVALHKIDLGIWLVAATALANFIVGAICLKIGKKNNSMALTASGKHLQSDTWSTIGIISGLVLLYFTGYQWIDSALAIAVSIFIIYTAYTILRRSIAGIMDEADEKLITEMVEMLNNNRQENWVDMHNLRVIKYGSILHIDCHLTVPWYLNVHEAHAEIDKLAELVRKYYSESVELFVHSDGCLPFQCHICSKQDCSVRQYNFEKRITWTVENISKDKKHQLNG